MLVTFVSAPDPGASDSTPDVSQAITLAAGKSAILSGGQEAMVPYGTSVIMPGRRPILLFGHRNTVSTDPGTIVSVPVDAEGPADNTVIARTLHPN